VHAALNLYAVAPDAFGDEARDLAGAFAAYAGVAVANMHLYDGAKQLAEHMQTAMRSRAVIDQAKAILMAQRHCTAEEAFDVLIGLSQSSHRKLREVAQALVDATSGRG